MPTCLWTNETSDRPVPVELDVPSRTGGAGSERTVYVLPEHEADLRAYVGRVARYGRTFFVAILAITALLVAVPLVGDAAGWSDRSIAASVGLGVVALGALIVAFPFATPETVGAFGVRTSVRIARVLGGITVALGVWITAFVG